MTTRELYEALKTQRDAIVVLKRVLEVGELSSPQWLARYHYALQIANGAEAHLIRVRAANK
jgi:hypothetical protein